MDEDRSVLIVSLVILLTGILLGGALLYAQWQSEKGSSAGRAVPAPSAAPNNTEQAPTKEIKTRLILNLEKVKPLDKGHFEIWAEAGDRKISGGKFGVDGDGNLVDLNGNKLENDLAVPLAAEKIQKIFITIEPEQDQDKLPSGIIFLQGDLVEGRARLLFGAVNLNQAAGSFVLATPTDGVGANETSGLWFMKLAGNQTESAGLSLPDAPEGWKYEGWAIYQGQPISMGRFSRVNGPDDFNNYSGGQDAPAFPGEDFLQGAPEGFVFPVNLADGRARVAVSLEPDLAGSDPTGSQPFQLEFLSEEISQFALDHENYDLVLNLNNFPAGSVEIKQ